MEGLLAARRLIGYDPAMTERLEFALLLAAWLIGVGSFLYWLIAQFW